MINFNAPLPTSPIRWRHSSEQPGTLNWIIAYHRWRAEGCRLSWEHYRTDQAMKKRALPYLHEARASDELAALAERQARKILAMDTARRHYQI